MATTAILMTLLFCAGNTAMLPPGLCKDNNPPRQIEVSVLDLADNGDEALMRFRRDGRELLTVYADGHMIKHDAEFTLDEAALRFWQAMASAYRNACPPIADALKNVPVLQK